MSTRLFYRLLFLLLLCAALLSALLPERRGGPDVRTSDVVARAELPAEAIETLGLILRDGPFPYRKDGSTFHNREYTVPTPGAADRGARRIVTGGDPPEVFYYTADHYRSFRRIEAPR